MKIVKNGARKIFYLLLGIVLAISLILVGVNLISSNSKFATISCITQSTVDGNYENAVYGGKVSINGFSMGDKTTFQLKVGQTVNLNATPNDGFLFAGYYAGGTLISSSSNFKFELTKNQNQDVYVKFAKAVTLNLSVKNPFNENDVRQIEKICFVGQEIVVSELVAKACDASWEIYFQNSTPTTFETLSNIVCEKNTITVGNQSSTLSVEPSEPTDVGATEEDLEVRIKVECSEGVSIRFDVYNDGLNRNSTTTIHNGIFEGFAGVMNVQQTPPYNITFTRYNCPTEITAVADNGFAFDYWEWEYNNGSDRKIDSTRPNPCTVNLSAYAGNSKQLVIRVFALKICNITYMENATDEYMSTTALKSKTYQFPTEIPEKDGYTLEGWTSSPDSTSNIWRSGTQTCTGDKVWYPVWNRKNVVQYYYIDSTGAWKTVQDTESKQTLFSASGVKDSEGVEISVDVVKNKEFVYNGKTYTFIGYSDNENDFLPKYANQTDKAGLSPTVTLYGKQINLYAVYVTTITLTYHAEGAIEQPGEYDLPLGRCAGVNETLNNQTIEYSLSGSNAKISDNIVCDGWVYENKYYSLDDTIDIVWDCDVYAYWVIKENTLDGIGTKNNPYLIKNYDDYLCLALGVKSGMFSSKTQYFKQTENIDISKYGIYVGEYDVKTDAQVDFKGVYDGDNHILTLNLDRPYQDYVAMFGCSDGTIKNVKVNSNLIRGNNYVAGVCAYNKGIIENCSVEGIIDGVGHYVGGICGYNTGTITTCYSDCTVSSTGSYVGGILGVNNGLVTKCYNDGNVTGANTSFGLAVGGIAGISLSKAEINNCFNNSKVVGQNYQWVGGIAGQNHGQIKNYYNKGSAYGYVYVGGICGQNSGTVTNGYNIGVATSSYIYVGSIIGYNTGTISYTYYKTGTAFDGNGTTQNAFGSQTLGMQTENPQSIQSFRNAGLGANVSILGMDGQSLDFALNIGKEFLDELDGAEYCSWIVGDDDYPAMIKNGVWNKTTFDDNNSIGWVGSGTKDNPYLIGSADDLAWLSLKVKSGISYKNTYFKVIKDIIFDEKSSEVFNPIGGYDNEQSYSYYFAGIFDGDNYAIVDFAPNINHDYAGLFGYNTGTITNLTIKDANITGKNYLGAICGYNTGTISFCTVEGTVKGTSSYIGGICGVSIGVVTNCINNSKVVGDSAFGLAVGGVVGINLSAAEVRNSFNTGEIKGTNYQWLGGLVGQNHGKIINSYNEGKVSGYVYTGGIAGQNSGQLSNLYSIGEVTSKMMYSGSLIGYNTSTNIDMCYYLANTAKDGSNAKQKGVGCGTQGQSNQTEIEGVKTFDVNAKLSSPSNIVGQQVDTLLLALKMGREFIDNGEARYITWSNEVYPTLITNGSWNESSIWRFIGDGDLNNPFMIVTEQDLLYLSIYVNGGNTFNGLYFKLANDIVLSSEVSKIFGTIGGYGVNGERKFEGTFDGDNFKIANISINSPNDYQGLFGYSSGTIKNLGIEASSISGKNYVGGICGYNTGLIENCYVNCTVSATGSYVGGIVGVNNGIVNKCYNLGSVAGSNSAFGLAVGGIAGISLSKAEIFNCFNNGTINAPKYQWVGGIAGQNHGKLSNAYNNGNVTGEVYIGGISGQNSGDITTTYSSGNIKSNIVYAGGVAGYNSGNIKYSFYLKNSAKDGNDFEQYGVGASSAGTAISDKSDNTILFDINQNVSKIKVAGTYVNNLFDGLRYAHLFLQSDEEKYCSWSERNNNYPSICDDSTIPVKWNPYTANVLNKDNPEVYLIYNLEDWNDFVANVNAGKNYKYASVILMANINLNGSATNPTSVVGWYDQERNESNFFAGVFDGNGHTISGIYINDSSQQDYVGLFACNEGVIQNITISGEIKGKNYVGGICGYNTGRVLNCTNKCKISSLGSYVGGIVGVNNGEVNHCANLGIVQGSNSSFGLAVGGIAGINLSKGVIENAFTNASVSASTYQWVGGVVGQNHGAVINCGNAGNVNANTYVGGLIGQNSGNVANCYNYGTASAVNVYCGGIVGYSTGNIDFVYYLEKCAKDGSGKVQNGVGASAKGSTTADVALKTIKFTTDGKISGITSAFGRQVNNVQDALNAFVLDQRNQNKIYDSWSYGKNKYLSFGFSENVWNGTSCAKNFAGGDGSADNPYQIYNAEQLKLLTTKSTNGKYYILTSDIYLNNFNISSYENLQMNAWSPVDFYGNLDGQNFVIYGLYINDANYSNQGLFATNYGTIQNLALINGYVKAFNNVGAFAGTCGTDALIKNCSNFIEVRGYGENAGGIVGENNGIIDFCQNFGKVYDDNKNAGGIAGVSTKEIINCSNFGAVECGQTIVGGIVGQLTHNSTVENSFNLGAINANSCVGGIVGLSEEGNIKNTYSGGEVKGNSDFTGAIVGQNNNSVIEYSYYLKSSANCGKNQSGVGSSTNNNFDEDGETFAYNQNLSTSLVTVCGIQSYSLKDNLEVWLELNTSVYEIPYYHWMIKNNQVVFDPYWQGGHYYCYSGGNGTSANPYLISTSYDLAYLANQVNNGITYAGKYFVMTNNIYINDETFAFDDATGLVKVSDGFNTAYLGTGIVGEETRIAREVGKWYANDKNETSGKYYGKLYQWVPIGQGNANYHFDGNFDGYNYFVSGLYINSDNINLGLFGNVRGVVQNVGIVNSYIRGNQNVAGIVSINNGTVSNCYNEAIVLAKTSTAGGVVGTVESQSYLYNSYNNGTVWAKSNAGGIVGTTNGTIKNVYNWGNAFNGTNKAGVYGTASSTALTNAYGWSNTTIAKKNSTIITKNEIGSIQTTLNSLSKSNGWSLWRIDLETGKPSFDISLWNGASASGYAGGNGTKDSPYLIATPEQLLYFSTGGNRGQYAKIIKDLYLNDETFEFQEDTGLIKVTDGTNVAFVGTGVKGNGVGFNTVFDKNPSTKGVWYVDENGNEGNYDGDLIAWNGIKNLSTNLDGDNHKILGLYSTTSGLIETLTAGTIKNTKIVNSLIVGENVGGVVNIAYGGNIENCSFAGAIVGKNIAGIVQQTTFKEEDIKSETLYGDQGGSVTFYSGFKYTNIIQSSNYATLVGEKVGGIVQDAQFIEKIQNCINISNIYATQSVGGILQKYYGNNKEVLVGKQCNPKVSGSSVSLSSAARNLNNKLASYGVGTTEKDVYGVQVTLDNNKNYGNINCLGSASGIINEIDAQATTTTTFRYEYIYWVSSGKEVIEVHATGSETFYYCPPNIMIKNCENYGDITGGDNTSGVSGKVNQNSRRTVNTSGIVANYGNVTGKNYVAGIFSQQNHALTGVENYGNITGKNYIGGISAVQNANITSSKNYGNIAGDDYVGGISGNQKSTISAVESYGNIVGRKYVGGISGYQTSSTTNAKFFGEISAQSYVGGVSGYAKANIENAYTKVNISASSTYAGGIVGYIVGNVVGGWSDAKLVGNSYVGGIAGFSSGALKDCYTAGEIEVQVAQAGGIAGEANSTLTNCWTVSKVTGQYYIGGLVGYGDDCSFTNCKYPLMFAQASSSEPSAQKGIGTDEGAIPSLRDVDGVSYFDKNVLIALDGSISVVDEQKFFELVGIDYQSGVLEMITNNNKNYVFNEKSLIKNNCGLTVNSENALLFMYRFGYVITVDTNGTGTIPYLDGWNVADDAKTATKLIGVNGNIGNLPVPVAWGYKFEGWFKDSTLFVEKVDFGYKYDSTFTKLYAKWSVSAQVLTLDGTKVGVNIPQTDGWTIKSDNKQIATKIVYVGSPIGTLPEIRKDGYVFDGWYLEQDFKTRVTATMLYNWSEDITLYPKLIKNELSLTIRLDGVEWKNSGIMVELYSENDLNNPIWAKKDLTECYYTINQDDLILNEGTYRIKATIWTKAQGNFADQNFDFYNLKFNVYGKSSAYIDYYSITLMKDETEHTVIKNNVEYKEVAVDSVYIKKINNVQMKDPVDIHNNTQIVLKGTRLTIAMVVNKGDGYVDDIRWIDENGEKYDGDQHQISNVAKPYYLTAYADKSEN